MHGQGGSPNVRFVYSETPLTCIMAAERTDEQAGGRMPETKYDRNIIITVGDNLDSKAVLARDNLATKLSPAPEFHMLETLQSLKGQDLSNTRIYIHGHCDYYGVNMSGANPEGVASALLQSGMSTPRVISITGCNAARGIHCRRVADQVWNEAYYPDYYGTGAISQLPGLTEAKMSQDSRLVDTTEPAMTVSIGSFAQRFHKSLQEGGVDTTVHARLFVVNIEEGGTKFTEQTAVDDFEGVVSATQVSKHQHPRSKVRITSAETAGDGVNGQQFEYVDYPTTNPEVAPVDAPAGAESAVTAPPVAASAPAEAPTG